MRKGFFGTSAHSKSPGLEVIKSFSCSTQLSMKFVLLMNLRLLTFFLNRAEQDFMLRAEDKKKIYNFGARSAVEAILSQ